MITDYVVGEKWANEIERIFLDREFPWYYVDDVTHQQTDNNYGFYHGIFHEGRIISNTYNLIMPILYQLCDKQEIKYDNVLRVRAGLITKSGYVGHHAPHVDYVNLNHKTLLYYVNDSDGDTYFFDDDKNVVEKITPKKGKCILFDGNILHASSSPSKNNRRIVINFNFI